MLIATRGGSKSFLLALYSMLYSLINQGSKVIIVGAAFRQAKVVFEYCEFFWRNAPILRDLVGTNRENGPRRDVDRCTMRLGDSIIIALPLGDGSKIRGQRANVIIADEFASIPKSIYEEVVSGFAATRASPVAAMKRAALVRVLKKLGRWTPAMEEREQEINRGNQAIIAGTASFTFNHFADYWKEYKTIIESRGEPKKLAEIRKGKKDGKFNWKNYSVIRMPVELLPENFMDEEHVGRAQVTTDSATYGIEYGAIFAGDTNGFYKRSLIETCVVRPDNLHFMLPNVNVFSPVIKGDRAKEYIYSVDTASESDNFSITLLELHINHNRIVYGWTTNREKHLERIRNGTVKERNFYAYAARKIRDLMKTFNCKKIVMDSQGGGRAVLEALHDMDKMEPNELPIWEVRSEDPNKPKPDDDQQGLHIVELVEFSDAKWVYEANHGLKKDLEDKVLLFPYFDPLKIYEANKEDKRLGRVYINKKGEEVQVSETLEDVIFEIEELKNELTTIVHTQTGATMRDHWDVPEVKLAGGKKGRLRKDRYTSLLMANMAARKYMRSSVPVQYSSTGGFAKDVSAEKKDPNLVNMGMWQGNAPSWFTNPQDQPIPYQCMGIAVRRNRG